MRLTRDEILLVTGLVAALLLGSVIKHYRDQARLAAPVSLTPAKGR